MSLLVEYSVQEGKAQAQIDGLNEFVAGLKALGDAGFSYTAYETDDPAKFIAVFEFEDDAAKQRFLDSAPFVAYRDSAKERFTAPPNTTTIRRVASTWD
ncbi:MAG: putative quinol monooxygenase [Hyphomicrobiales bacterium]